MSINVFSLAGLQPLAWIALIALAVAALLTFYWGRDVENSFLFLLVPHDRQKKWLRWIYAILFIAAMILWEIIVIANHTTPLQDVINMTFLVGFSFMYIILVEFVLAIGSFLLICIGAGTWLLWQYLATRNK